MYQIQKLIDSLPSTLREETAERLSIFELKFDESNTNPLLKDGLINYLFCGIRPGSFLEAVLCNDMKGAYHAADETNIQNMFHLIRFLWQNFPVSAWGDSTSYNDWASSGGIIGRAKALAAKTGAGSAD